MANDKISVAEKHLTYQPNMPPYEKMESRSLLEEGESEIDWSNEAANALDKHRYTHRRNKLALIWEGTNGDVKKFTFNELSELTNKWANVLKSFDIGRGDRIFNFLPRVPEVYISFLGTMKTAAIASNLFAAFGENALRDRLKDSGAIVVVTNKELKSRLDAVRHELPDLKYVFVVGASSKELKGQKGEYSFDEEIAAASIHYEVEKMDKEDVAFLSYTSGSTGKPKGIVHVHGGMLQRHTAGKMVLDYKEEDIFFATVDPGWITGMTCALLMPWSNGVTMVVYEGRFDAEKWYALIEKYKVTNMVSTPTAIRMLMSKGDELPKKHKLNTVRHLTSYGEPLNPEAMKWFNKTFGVWPHDVYWQTENGSIMITNFPSLDIKLGSMGRPYPGIKVAVLGPDGQKLDVGKEGDLVIKTPWPAMFRGIWNNEQRYREYFKDGWYFTGDTAVIDKDGYVTYIGRNDDLIKTSGERVGAYEIESTLIEHPAIAEAGVVGIPDPEGIRGDIIKAFIVLRKGYTHSPELENDIKQFIKVRLAGYMYPRQMEFREKLPRTQTGKIMRRVLKMEELKKPVGDVSTMEN